MIVILSQKIDSESTYSDELYKTYHYPGRYRNQLHEGDIFVYYQGNRYSQEQRYYFGTGKIGKIRKSDNDNYYAELLDCKKFKQKVPIYLPEEEIERIVKEKIENIPRDQLKHIEQLGYNTVRKSFKPPWQSSIRPLSEQAYKYILKAGEIFNYLMPEESIEMLDDKLKESIRHYFVEKDRNSITAIRKYATMIEGINTNGEVAEELSDEYIRLIER